MHMDIIGEFAHPSSQEPYEVNDAQYCAAYVGMAFDHALAGTAGGIRPRSTTTGGMEFNNALFITHDHVLRDLKLLVEVCAGT